MEVTENGITLKIGYDENPENPRNWDNAGTMVCFHRRYFLGDRHNYNNLQDFFESKEYRNAYAIKPLFLYDHSGLAISTESYVGKIPYAEWDSMQVGFILITKDDVKKKIGIEPTKENKNRIEKMLESEVETYNNYLGGSVYEFQVLDEEKNVIDSCGGFNASSIKEALIMMKDYSSVEHESLFKKLEKELIGEAVM